MRLAETIGTRKYAAALRRIYPTLENISVDYAIMEPATRASGTARVFVLPAKVGWSDIGSWSAVYELLASQTRRQRLRQPILHSRRRRKLLLGARKIYRPQSACSNLVLVETDDAILICPRDRSQDVGKIVKYLEQQKLASLL